MGDDFFAYLQQLELMAFFSGYPLVYSVIHFIAGKTSLKNNFTRHIPGLLPLAYALTGTLYLALQLKNLYPDYSLENIKLATQLPLLMIWGILSILFWIPVLGRKPVWSLLHSLVFFFFLLKDLILHAFQSSADKNVVRNEMKIYTDSLLLNLGALILVFLISFLISRIKRQNKSLPAGK